MKNGKPMILLLSIILAGCSLVAEPDTNSVKKNEPISAPANTPALNIESTSSVAFPDSNSVSISFDPITNEQGIYLITTGYTSTSLLGFNAISTSEFDTQINTGPLYFTVSENFYDKLGPITIDVEYYDESEGMIYFQYDSLSTQCIEPRYKSILMANRKGTHSWRTASIVINDANFGNQQKYGADFSIYGEINPVSIRSIKITRGGEIPVAATPLPTKPIPAEYPPPLQDKAVFTYFFYWYDAPNGWAFNLTNVPVDFQTMSWNDTNWFLKQIMDIKSADIDVILPVYDYTPGVLHWWVEGIPHLAESLEIMRLAGTTPPAVALFVDSTSMQEKDLRELVNQEELYSHIHYFFTTIPRGYWALAENSRPIIWFYTAGMVSAFDQSFIDYIYQNFEDDFSARPYLVLDRSWDYPTETIDGQQVRYYSAAPLTYDATYSWAGDNSPTLSKQISDVSPGFDDHGVEGRIPVNYVDRENGMKYVNDYARAIKCASPWLAIETWNEFMESTQIAETQQYGREYINLTKELNSYFRQGVLPPGSSLGDFTGKNFVSYTAGDLNLEKGISLVSDMENGQYTIVEKGDKPGIQVIDKVFYLYFRVDDSFYFNDHTPITMTITYFDEGTGEIRMDYDTAACGADLNIETMYKNILIGYMRNTGTWQTLTIEITDATFANNQHSSSDFRIFINGDKLTINNLIIQK